MFVWLFVARWSFVLAAITDEAFISRTPVTMTSKRHRKEMPILWPRVYVYDLPMYWDVNAFKFEKLASMPLDNPDLFGPKCYEGLNDEYATHMYSAPMILLWRILRSPRLTLDPAEADLFFVPMWPKQKSQKLWEERCERDSNLNLASELMYLTERTAHRHFFIVGKGHVKVGGKCDAWWKKPSGLLRRAMRFAYSSDYGTGDREGQERYGPFDLKTPWDAEKIAADVLLEDDNANYPHLVSVPYPSSIHVSLHSLHRSLRPPDWIARKGQHAQFLASFVGGAHSRSTFAAVRKQLRQDCDRAGRDVCFYFNYDHSQGVFTCGLHKFMTNATFCFQPGGDSPYRKSLYDSILTGCIPVIFSEYNARVSSWHFWANHRQNSMVVINASTYLHGDFDVLRYLASIDHDIVLKMQHNIAAHAHRLQYALDDYPDDAVDVILRGAAHMAKARDVLIPSQLSQDDRWKLRLPVNI